MMDGMLGMAPTTVADSLSTNVDGIQEFTLGRELVIKKERYIQMQKRMKCKSAEECVRAAQQRELRRGTKRKTNGDGESAEPEEEKMGDR